MRLGHRPCHKPRASAPAYGSFTRSGTHWTTTLTTVVLALLSLDSTFAQDGQAPPYHNTHQLASHFTTPHRNRTIPRRATPRHVMPPLCRKHCDRQRNSMLAPPSHTAYHHHIRGVHHTYAPSSSSRLPVANSPAHLCCAYVWSEKCRRHFICLHATPRTSHHAKPNSTAILTVVGSACNLCAHL